MYCHLDHIAVDRRDVLLVDYGYSQGELGQFRKFRLPPLKHDKGDTGLLSTCIPFPAGQGFNGAPPRRDPPRKDV